MQEVTGPVVGGGAVHGEVGEELAEGRLPAALVQVLHYDAATTRVGRWQWWSSSPCLSIQTNPTTSALILCSPNTDTNQPRTLLFGLV